ncbi:MULTISPECIES: DUF2057 family protein [Dickeya]|uniref:UPF0319 protein DAQ1742_01142 n=1 Tax=Dickeya aquatica TaxID=1401087 RepID=A0A375A944_9GAMM|nr:MULTISPECIES: DUF2057 family protein [Dickeya]SLM62159.1 UPF0319 protein YccT precursor [Dickeya aquatica]
MKTLSVIATTTLWLLMLSTQAIATTLKLRPDVELIMVDGKRVSSLLLNGAESLELEKGYHQLVFQVLRPLSSSPGEKQLYRSPGLIAVFDTRYLSEVAIRLPALDTREAQERFTQLPDYQLLDSKKLPIPMRMDVLRINDATPGREIERLMAEYNQASQPASVSAFAFSTNQQDAAMPPTTSHPLDPLGIMQYWFQQADKETRQRFLEWAQKESR